MQSALRGVDAPRASRRPSSERRRHRASPAGRGTASPRARRHCCPSKSGAPTTQADRRRRRGFGCGVPRRARHRAPIQRSPLRAAGARSTCSHQAPRRCVALTALRPGVRQPTFCAPCAGPCRARIACSCPLAAPKLVAPRFRGHIVEITRQRLRPTPMTQHVTAEGLTNLARRRKALTRRPLPGCWIARGACRDRLSVLVLRFVKFVLPPAWPRVS